MTKFRKVLLTLAALGAFSLGGVGVTQAQDYYHSGGNHYRQGGYGQHNGYGQYNAYNQRSYAPYSGRSSGYYRTPQYHAPSMHYDRVYHADSYHWTPSRGRHTHGHYDVVPHYTPGHHH